MNNLLSSHLYLYLKSMYTLKKSCTFANLLMGEPSNSFAIETMREKHLKKNESLRKDLHLYLRCHSGTVFSFCLCKSSFS